MPTVATPPVDLTAETLIPLPAAASRVPPAGVALSTAHRWRLNGVRGNKLATVLVGGRRYTSIEALERFLAAINGGQVATPSLSAATAKRQKATAAALRDRHGITVKAGA